MVTEVRDRDKITTINMLLGLGESSAIALALETENSLVILDDKRARTYARNAGLNYTGTIGLVRLGYKKGCIRDIDALIADLRSIQFHLPSSVIDLIKND
jgi:predicted nucleic acid-binding protein